MKVAVWDTYVPSKNGDVLHFDIIVPIETEQAQVYQYGKTYLNNIQQPDDELNAAKCQMCHVEQPTDTMLHAIAQQGYYILELGQIPAHLPTNPSRTDLILHLRAHYLDLRFADFSQKSLDEILQIYKTHNMNTNYKPIDCNFYDLLLSAASRKEHCTLIISSDNSTDSTLTIRTIIKDVFTKNKEEFALFDSGQIIRLDKIISINGELSPQHTPYKNNTCKINVGKES